MKEGYPLMLDQLHVSSLAPAVVAAQPVEEYFLWEYVPGRWLIVCDYPTGEMVEEGGEVFEVRSMRLHRGRRTGQPVEFSRLSDAERLCRVLNGDEPPSC
jgi:hypothetical protein